MGKRDAERRRRNKPADGIATQTIDVGALASQPVEIPEPDESWHQVAREWYDSLTRSATATLYEPSDWATAYLIAESLSRDLNEQFVGISEATGEVVKQKLPLKGASLSAYLKAMSSLLVTEGDRRRMRIEIERGGDPRPSATPAVVSSLDDHRKGMVS